MGKHRTLGTFLRATDDEDAKERPGDRLDYGIARSDRLEADETITDSQWVFNSIGLTKLTTHVIGGKSAVWIEGRVIGANYVLQNQITTSKLNPKTGQSRVYLGSIGIFVWAK